MIKRVLKAIKRFVPTTSNCEVVGCAKFGADDTKIKALDPIDHDDKVLQLCEKHQQWAQERNDFAEEMYDEFREFRKELGQEQIGEIQRLAHPQDGKLREDILMGDTEEKAIPLSQATEESQNELLEDMKMDPFPEGDNQ